MDIGPLIAGAGVAGLAIGFGAQSLVKDVITGFFILLEDQIRVGDVVEAGGVSGLVESMNLRTTVLRDLQGRVHVIPNGEIKVVTNMTKEWSRAVVDVSVSYREDLEEVLRVVRGVCDELAADPDVAPVVLDRPEVLGVDSLGDSSVAIRVMIKTRPLEQWRVAREFRRRVKNTFAARGIEIPYPQRTVHLVNAPAARDPRREDAPRAES
jgi:small conductance mechanosensitive channel